MQGVGNVRRQYLYALLKTIVGRLLSWECLTPGRGM